MITIQHFRYFWHKAVWRRSRSGKSYVVTMTIGSLQKRWIDQNGKCAITGLPMMLPDLPMKGGRSCKFSKGSNHCFHASLDRIDPIGGYTDDNIQFVCRAVNYAKCDGSDDQIKAFIEALRDPSRAPVIHNPYDQQGGLTAAMTE